MQGGERSPLHLLPPAMQHLTATTTKQQILPTGGQLQPQPQTQPQPLPHPQPQLTLQLQGLSSSSSSLYVPDESIYPPALASHESILADPRLFFETLDSFLAALGTKLMVPRIGGQDLNLHLFYREVTERGGLGEVIRFRRWKEITAALDILEGSLSASFVLRKHYLNLLYHYEQVHYFGVQGRLAPAPAPLPAPLVVKTSSLYEISPELELLTGRRKRKIDPLQIFGVDPAGSLGSTVTGAIHGKSDDGYVVSFVIGEEKVSGVMYHVPQEDTIGEQFAIVPGLIRGPATTAGSEPTWLEPNVAALQLEVRTKRPYKKNRAPPNRTRTGYNIFFKEQRAQLEKLQPELVHGKTVIEMWSRLSKEEKSLYNKRAKLERKKMAANREMSESEPPVVAEGASYEPTSMDQELGECDGSVDYNQSSPVGADEDLDPWMGHYNNSHEYSHPHVQEDPRSLERPHSEEAVYLGSAEREGGMMGYPNLPNRGYEHDYFYAHQTPTFRSPLPRVDPSIGAQYHTRGGDYFYTGHSKPEQGPLYPPSHGNNGPPYPVVDPRRNPMESTLQGPLEHPYHHNMFQYPMPMAYTQPYPLPPPHPYHPPLHYPLPHPYLMVPTQNIPYRHPFANPEESGNPNPNPNPIPYRHPFANPEESGNPNPIPYRHPFANPEDSGNPNSIPAHAHAHAHTHTLTNTHAHPHPHPHPQPQPHPHAHTHTLTNTHAHAHAHVHTPAHAHVHAHAHAYHTHEHHPSSTQVEGHQNFHLYKHGPND